MVTATVTGGNLSGSNGADNLTGIAQNGTGQIHIYAKGGNDTLNLDFSHVTKFSHGHHVRGDDDGSNDRGADTFNFRNLHLVDHVIVGRIEDFDPSRDSIRINGSTVSLTDLESGSGTNGGFSWRVVEYDADARDSATSPQQWLLIDTGQGYVFYALEGARVTNGNGAANSGNQEAHFVGANGGHRVTASELENLQTVGFSDPQNYVPAGYVAQGGVTINDDDNNYADAQTQINGTSSGDLIAAGLNDDMVQAGAGNDAVWGGSGSDTVFGEAGNDTIFGGTGNDELRGGTGDDSLRGENGNDLIFGGDQHDTIAAGQGNDTVHGGFGRDVVHLNQGNDVFHDVSQNDYNGADLVFGGLGDDTIFASGGNDTLYGEDGNDLIYGGIGNDVIGGGDQYDTIHAGEGNDVVSGGNGRDLIYLNQGDDVFNDNSQNDIHGHDSVYGGQGNDTLNGSGGNDTLWGQSGNDLIFGGIGNDVVGGGDGNDVLSGGAGADRFVFFNGFGTDRITDFAPGQSGERIDLSGVSSISSYSDLRANHLQQSGSNAIISDGTNNTIELVGINVSMLTSDDFVF